MSLIKVSVSTSSWKLSCSSSSESCLANSMGYGTGRYTVHGLIACFVLITTMYSIWQHCYHKPRTTYQKAANTNLKDKIQISREYPECSPVDAKVTSNQKGLFVFRTVKTVHTHVFSIIWHAFRVGLYN